MPINTKLLAFQKMNITLKKEGENPHFGSKYVTLNEVLDKVKGPLNTLGVLIIQNPELTGLKTILLDTEDDSKVESFMPYVETSTAQKLGSNNTYLRRYALVTMLGLEDDDDDGNAASRPASPPTRHNAPQHTEVPVIQTDTPLGLICACGLKKKRIQTKKPGANQGRWFYSCPKPMNKQCPNSFQWEDSDEPLNIEGTKEDYDPNTGALLADEDPRGNEEIPF